MKEIQIQHTTRLKIQGNQWHHFQLHHIRHSYQEAPRLNIDLAKHRKSDLLAVASHFQNKALHQKNELELEVKLFLTQQHLYLNPFLLHILGWIMKRVYILIKAQS